MSSIQLRHILASLLVIRAVAFSPAIPLAFSTLAAFDSDRLPVIGFVVLPALLFGLMLIASAWGIFHRQRWALWTTLVAVLTGMIVGASSVIPFVGYLVQLAAIPFVPALTTLILIDLIVIGAVHFTCPSSSNDSQV